MRILYGGEAGNVGKCYCSSKCLCVDRPGILPPLVAVTTRIVLPFLPSTKLPEGEEGLAAQCCTWLSNTGRSVLQQPYSKETNMHM